MARQRRRQIDERDDTTEVEQKQGTLAVTTQIVVSSRVVDGHVEEEEIEVETFVSDPAYVRIGAGATKQIVEFESVRVDISVSVPCYKEQVQDVIEEWCGFVAARLDRELQFYLGEGND